jgi:plastocyanin
MTIRRVALLVSICLTAAVTARAAEVMIEQSGQQFSQKSLALQPGDTVRFTNHDDVTHNIGVINDADDAADLGLQKPGEVLAYRFDKAGRFKIRCSIHPSMKMTVNVR